MKLKQMEYELKTQKLLEFQEQDQQEEFERLKEKVEQAKLEKQVELGRVFDNEADQDFAIPGQRLHQVLVNNQDRKQAA